MTTGTLSLKIITPERVVLDEKVQNVCARTIHGEHCLGGELTILPNHEPLITALAIDVIRYKFADGAEHTAAVIGGVLEVGENQVTVLSDVAELDTEIDEARAHDAKARAEAEKSQRQANLPVHVSEMAMAKAMARLKAYEFARNRKSRRPPG
jgi:F-type H+-transporting ATPase subunit epsilon